MYILPMPNSFSDGLMPVRISALGTMFFLGAALGKATPLPWWFWFALGVCVGLYMVFKFTMWIDSASEEEDDGAA